MPRPDLATIVVTGKDRVSWLNGMVTCDLGKRAPDTAAYGLVVARNGRVLSDVLVVFDDAAQRVLVAVPQSEMSTLREHFDHYLVMEDVEFAPSADAFEAWAFHGPRFTDALEAARGAGAVGGAADCTGLGGAFALAPAERSTEVRAALEHAIAAIEGAAMGDDGGWEALRLERAIPRFGIDFDAKTYPQEASLEKTAVSFNKGCYLGQEVVCMLEMRGHVKRKLVALVLDASQPPARGSAVSDESGVALGEVTSATHSPTLDKAVALAMLKRGHTEAGRRVLVAGIAGKVVDRPA